MRIEKKVKLDRLLRAQNVRTSLPQNSRVNGGRNSEAELGMTGLHKNPENIQSRIL